MGHLFSPLKNQIDILQTLSVCDWCPIWMYTPVDRLSMLKLLHPSVWIFSGRYFLNCSIFCYQTWYSGVLSWARESCRKKLVCYLQGEGELINETLGQRLSQLFLVLMLLFCSEQERYRERQRERERAWHWWQRQSWYDYFYYIF